VIVTVTPNPALDVTYRVAALRVGEVHRVRDVLVRAGGKGINVARVLQQLGEPCAAVGLAGGPDGRRLVAELRDAGLDVDFGEELPDVRRTLVVHADGGVTSFWEPGREPLDPVRTAQALLDAVRARLGTARAVAVSGSLPPRVDPELPARIARLCAERQVPAVLDLDGEPLHAAVASEGAVLMPNVDELETLTGARPQTPAEAAALAADLLHGGTRGRLAGVVVTLGRQGAVVVTTTGAVAARPVECISGNPTGAGDAACAAVARGLAMAGSLHAVNLRDLVADTVAVSAAAVLRGVAGEIDVEAARSWRGQVQVEDL
jgi:1-phosphofructokinase family hexose kinase